MLMLTSGATMTQEDFFFGNNCSYQITLMVYTVRGDF